MAALAAGVSAALAAGPQEANAQATEIMIPLNSGAEIVINLSGISAQVQGDVMATLQGCIEEGTTSRDECVAGFATDIAQIRLNEIVRSTHQQLVPLENDIGLTAEEIIQEPVFCEYAPDANAAEGCTAAIGNVQLAAAELRLAAVRERRIAAETREGEIDGAIESSQRGVDDRRQRNAETEDDLAVANAVIEDFFQTKVQAGTLGQIREQINVELGKTLTGEDLTQKVAEAEAKYIAPHEARLTAMQAVFTPEEIQTVFGGSLTNTVSLNLKGETNAQIYADVFARIDAGLANDDDRRREVRAAVEAQLGITPHQAVPRNAEEMRDSLNKGYGTETRTETQTVEEPPGSGNYVEKEVVVSETTIPFSERFPFVVSHEPYVVMYPKTPGASRYQVQGRVAGLAAVETTVEIPPTGALPEADIHAAINKAFIAGNFRNAGLNGALEHLCGRSDATLGTSADVSAGAIGQTDMLQNVMQMFGGEMMDIRTGFLSAGALQGMTPDLRWLTIDGDFGAMNQNDPAKVQNMMTALFGSSHGEIANNMSKARGVINSGGAETPSFQALYTAIHPEDVANGFANLKAVMGAQGLAKMNLG